MYRNTVLRAFPSQVSQVNLNLNKKFRVGKRSVRSNTNLLSKNEKKKKVLWALRNGTSERSGGEFRYSKSKRSGVKCGCRFILSLRSHKHGLRMWKKINNFIPDSHSDLLSKTYILNNSVSLLWESSCKLFIYCERHPPELFNYLLNSYSSYWERYSTKSY